MKFSCWLAPESDAADRVALGAVVALLALVA